MAIFVARHMPKPMPGFTLLQQVTITDPGGSWHAQQVDVLLENGVVREIAKQGLRHKEAQQLAGLGLHLTPGLCDLYVQLTDPGYEWRATLQQIAQEAYASGYSDLLCMPNTAPPLDKADPIRALQLRAQQLPVHFHFAGALSADVAGVDMAELYELHEAGALAFSDGKQPVQDAGLLMRCLFYLRPFNGLVMQMPHDKQIAGKGLANESPATTALGFKGIPALAEEMMMMRDLALLEYTGGRIHFGPITTQGAVEILRAAKAKGLQVTAHTAPQYLLLTDSALSGFDPRLKVIPPLRTAADVQAVCAAVADGSIDAIATHHTPMALEDKAVEYDHAGVGMSGLRTAFAVAHTALVTSGLMSLAALVQRMAHQPRQLLGLPAKHVAIGASGPWALLQPDAQFHQHSTLPQHTFHNYPYEQQALQGAAWCIA